MLIIYIYLIRFVLKSTKTIFENQLSNEYQSDQKRREQLKPLLAYPFIYLLFSIPTFTYQMIGALHPEGKTNYVLSILSVTFSSSLDACYAIVFAIFNATIHEWSYVSVKKELKDIFRRPIDIIHTNYGVENAASF